MDGYVEIFDNRMASLQSLQGLEQLEHVSIKIAIVGNPKLTSLQALRPDLQGSLTFLESLEVRQNDLLPTCEVTELATAIEAAGTLGDSFAMGNLADRCSDS